MVAGPRSTDGNFAGPIDASHAADGAEQRGTPGSPETPRTQVDEFVRESHAPPGPSNGNGAGGLLAMVRRWFGLESKPAEDHDIGHEGWIALSDIVSFFETVKTHNLRQIRAQYDEIVTNGFESDMIYDLLMNRYHVAAAHLENDIGHQNPNPYRSITEITSNAVDAMRGMEGDVNIAIENGRYAVSDSGVGMSADEVFEKLLIPQLSGKSGVNTIGRFGIGFYTALAHLKDHNSRVIVETKRDGHQAVRIEFIRLNGQMGVRVEASTRMDVGTTVLVRDAGLDPDRITQELLTSMRYVTGRRIMANGRQINDLDPARVSRVGNGTMYVSEKKSTLGKVVVTMGGGMIEEFAVSGDVVPELVVFDFPFDIEFPESRNRLRVDSGVVNQVRAFIDAVEGIEGYTNKIAYLNAIAPMITQLQKRNESPERANDLAEYARSVATKHFRGKTLIPDDPLYNIMAQKGFIRVNELYLGRDWQARFDEPPEWRGSTKILLTDFIPVAATGIMYDRERNIVLLSRPLYEMHKNDPVGLKVLLDLAKAQGSWGTATVSQTEDAAQPPLPAQVQVALPIGTASPLRAEVIDYRRPALSPVIEGIIERNPVLMTQLGALRDLENTDRAALDLLAKLDTTFIRHLGLEALRSFASNAVGPGEPVLFSLFVDRMVPDELGNYGAHAVVRSDGKPLFVDLLQTMPNFASRPRFIVVEEGGGPDEETYHRLVKPDGTPLSDELFSYAKHERGGLLSLKRENGLWLLLKPDGTPAIDGESEYAQVAGENNQFIVSRRTDGNWQIIRTSDKTVVLEERFERVITFGNDREYIAGIWPNGSVVVYELHDAEIIAKNIFKVSIYPKSPIEDFELLEDREFLAVKYASSIHINSQKWEVYTSVGALIFEGAFGYRFHVGGKFNELVAVAHEGKPYRILRTRDFKPAIEEEFRDVFFWGKNNEYIVVKKSDEAWRLLRSDGTPHVEERFKWVRAQEDDARTANGGRHLLAAERLDGTLQVFEDTGEGIIRRQAHYLEPGNSKTDSFLRASRLFMVEGNSGLWHSLPSLGYIRMLDGQEDPAVGLESNGENKVYAFRDFANRRVMTSLDVSSLASPAIRANLKHLVEANFDAGLQGIALSLLSFPEELFNFALAILPHTKMDMRYAQNLLRILTPLSEKYTPEILGAFSDIALSVGWGDAPPRDAISKLETLAEHLSVSDILKFRDALAESFAARFALTHGDWSKAAVLSPRHRAYAYYLAMDTAELLPEGASQIPVVSGSKAFSLVDLNIAVTSNNDWWEKFQGSNRRAAREIREQTSGTDRQISARRVQHAMYNLSDGINLLYLRALIQNSLDAIRKNEEEKGTINVESFREDGTHVLRITDPVGMSFSDAINKLFVYGESTTDKFGVGFFTIYPGAKEIRIKTGTGDGRVSIFTLRPIYDGERVVDVTISYVVKREDFKGTIIERTSNGEIPELDAAFDRSSTLSYGRFLSEIGVTYNGRQVNLSMQPVADQDVTGIGGVRIYEATENAITRGGLYVKDIPRAFFNNLPPAIRRLIAPRGIVIDLPRPIPIVRSGNEFLDPVNLEWRLMPQVNAMLLRSYLIRFAGGEVDITGIPDVYFNSMYGFANEKTIAPEIREDAERLMRGEGLPEIGRYQDERYFIQLLTLLPCLRIDGEIISIYELLERFEKGARIDTSKLPTAITSRLERAMSSKEARGSGKEMMDRVGQELGVSGRGRELTLGDWREDALHRHWERLDARSEDANSYDAFLSIVGELMTSAGNSHHTIGFSSFLERNALADHATFAGRIEMYFSITAAEKYARELFEILSVEDYPAGRMQALMAELIDKVTHEMTHDLSEQPNEWTHDNEFYEEQQLIVSKLLRSGPLELEKLWRFLKAVYPNPTFMPAEDFLKLLLTRRAENPSGAGPAATPAATPTPAPQAPPAPAAPADGSPEASSSEPPSVSGLADTGETSGGQYIGYSDYGIEATARQTQRSAARVHQQQRIATQQRQPVQVRTPIAAPVRPSVLAVH